MRVAAALLAMAVPAVATAQQAPPPAAAAPPSVTVPAAELPISIDRIREGLAHEPALILQSGRVFRVDITERQLRYFELPPLLAIPREPTPMTPRWHDEFLSMVTPPEFRNWQAFTGKDLVVVAGTSLATVGAASIIGAAINAIVEARRNGREAAAQQEVEDALKAFLAVKEGQPTTGVSQPAPQTTAPR